MTVRRWTALVPEVTCTDLQASLIFYRDALGFEVLYQRPEDGFAYLELGDAQLMLEQGFAGWLTGPLERPFGRGINLQIEVLDARKLEARLKASGCPLFRTCQDAWYRDGDVEHGQIEFLVQDPDGYLLRFVEPLGERPIGQTG
ncbi:MAG: bleomycin resistance protein [Brevundimonas sp.]|uniref:bleomycin resistance protein n=1 Tax=Brevundimonas sp. TaxID=1871086 RepID=UPI0022C44ED0|nr:VOC family protein [Brevundimonas sp.]MCZ8193802.1 VOC family protein [Brevundimonas sp.]